MWSKRKWTATAERQKHSTSLGWHNLPCILHTHDAGSINKKQCFSGSLLCCCATGSIFSPHLIRLSAPLRLLHSRCGNDAVKSQICSEVMQHDITSHPRCRVTERFLKNLNHATCMHKIRPVISHIWMTMIIVCLNSMLNHLTSNSQFGGLMTLSFVFNRWRSHPVCRLLWQCQPQPWQPLQWVPDTVTFFTLPALISRRGYLYRDWSIETEGRCMHHPILQAGISVPRDLQWPLSGDHSTAYICTPHCRKEAMRISGNIHQLVFPHCWYAR